MNANHTHFSTILRSILPRQSICFTNWGKYQQTLASPNSRKKNGI